MKSEESNPLSSKIRSILRKLNADSGGQIHASATMSTDGHIISSALAKETDKNRFAAMCASLLVLADQTTQQVSIGQMRQLMVTGNQGVMLVTYAGSDAVLALSARPKISIGKVLIDANRAAEEIRALIQAG